MGMCLCTPAWLRSWSLQPPDPLQASPNPRLGRGASIPAPPPSTTCTSVRFQDRLLLACTSASPHVFGGAVQHLLVEQGLLLTWERNFSLLPSCPTSHGSCHGAQTEFFPGWDPLLRSKSSFWTCKILSWFHQTAKHVFTPLPHRVNLPSYTLQWCLVQLHSFLFAYFALLFFKASLSSLKSAVLHLHCCYE